MNRLSEAERNQLRLAVADAHACTGSRGKWFEHVEPVVEAIVAARLASARVQLDLIVLMESERADDLGDDHARWTSDRLARIAAVLGSDAHTEQKGTGE